jgi:CSLREA domain-containing protein
MSTETYTRARAWTRKVLAVGLLLAAMMPLAASPAQATTTYTVNTTGDRLDAQPGDGFCITGQAQECTLRAAIQEANETPGEDTIDFDIFGTGVKTISINSSFNGGLPEITAPVTIDGYTQTGSSPNTASRGTNAKLRVVVDGAALSPATNGLDVGTSNSTIRGLVISRAFSFGLNINGSGNRVAGNFIGTNASGNLDRGNGVSGINISSGSGNTIGGPTRADRNLISGNGKDGVSVGAPTTRVEGNLIGTDRDGLGRLGNDGSGVLVANDVSPVTILDNSIFSNGGLGVDLSPDFEGDGRTANDPGDADTGANNLQNFPVITSAKAGATSTTIKGRLNSEVNTPYIVQFFSNPSGTNEGQQPIGQKIVNTDLSGNVSFTFKPNKPVVPGQNITATATRNVFNIPSSTSEFSTPRTVTDATAPTVKSVSPAPSATGVSPSANASATFSEAMNPSTINTSTVTLKRSGATTKVGATIGYDAANKRAVLNPTTNLKLGATYVATVTTGAKDLAGNALDQSPSVAGSQAKSWKFTVRK